MFHDSTVVTEDGLQFKLTGGGDLVRLLGFSLILDPQAKTTAQKALLTRMRAIGRYGADASLDEILAELQAMTKKHPGDAFAAYWLEQVQILTEVEDHYEKRGWEWAREQSGLSIFDRFHHAVMLLDGLLNRPAAESYPFYERALWLRGRLLYWLGEERHGPNEISPGQSDLTVLYQRYPEDKLLAVYNGEQIDFRYRLTGDEQYLIAGLEKTLQEVRFNTPLRTSEVLHTDRVYVYGSEHLKAMLTGDGVPESTSPYYAVSWQGTDKNFTALVKENGKTSLTVQVFSHADSEQKIKMRLWQLIPGRYQVTKQVASEPAKLRVSGMPSSKSAADRPRWNTSSCTPIRG